MSINESDILRQVIQGNDDAFTLLVDSYQRPVYNLCYRMLGSVEEAEDAAQETFWRAYQAIQRYDTNRSFITWLLSIAAHHCIDIQRRRRLPSLELDALPEDIIPDTATPDPEKTYFQVEEQRMVHQLLNRLDTQDRAAVILRYWYDFSEQEIASALSLSVSAVKSRLFRARRQMAQDWQAAPLPKPVPEGGNHHGSPDFK